MNQEINPSVDTELEAFCDWLASGNVYSPFSLCASDLKRVFLLGAVEFYERQLFGPGSTMNEMLQARESMYFYRDEIRKLPLPKSNLP